MKYTIIFQGDIIDPHVKDHEGQLLKAMEACLHLLWGYMINVDPSQCTFRRVSDQSPTAAKEPKAQTSGPSP